MQVNNSLSKFSETLLIFYTERDNLKKLLEKVQNISAYWNSEKVFADFFSNPNVSIQNKKEFIVKFLDQFKCDNYIKNTFFLLLDFHLNHCVSLFFEILEKKIIEKLNYKNIFVYSSCPIDEEQKIKLKREYQKLLSGFELVFHYLIDPKLILGIKVKYDDLIDEYSLASQLKKISEELQKSLLES